jgi:hypothetical protein
MAFALLYFRLQQVVKDAGVTDIHDGNDLDIVRM